MSKCNPFRNAVIEGNFDHMALYKRAEWASAVLEAQHRRYTQDKKDLKEYVHQTDVMLYDPPRDRVIDPCLIKGHDLLLSIIAPDKKLRRRSEEVAWNAMCIQQQSTCRGYFPEIKPAKAAKQKPVKEVVMQRCARYECANTFPKVKGNKKFCSTRCRKLNHWHAEGREKRLTPEYRASLRLKVARKSKAQRDRGLEFLLEYRCPGKHERRADNTFLDGGLRRRCRDCIKGSRKTFATFGRARRTGLKPWDEGWDESVLAGL